MQDTQDVVVFLGANNEPFSNDPRWNDPQVQKDWKANHAKELGIEVQVEDDDPDEVLPYGEWTNDELRAELSERKLSVDGKKSDLVTRLEDDDRKTEV